MSLRSLPFSSLFQKDLLPPCLRLIPPRLRHGLVKWFGVCLAVASGLAVGPEGPMIFIGAFGRGSVCRAAEVEAVEHQEAEKVVQTVRPERVCVCVFPNA